MATAGSRLIGTCFLRGLIDRTAYWIWPHVPVFWRLLTGLRHVLRRGPPPDTGEVVATGTTPLQRWLKPRVKSGLALNKEVLVDRVIRLISKDEFSARNQKR
jgi:hypothetical protein